MRFKFKQLGAFDSSAIGRIYPKGHKSDSVMRQLKHAVQYGSHLLHPMNYDLSRYAQIFTQFGNKK